MEQNKIKLNGQITVAGVTFMSVEGGFGEGKKCMLAKDIATIHGRELKDINRLINNNRPRFKDGLDVIDFLSDSESLRDFAKENGLIGSNRTQNVYLLSERGYSKLLKLLEDDLAWELYDKLVDNYFNLREENRNQQTEIVILQNQVQALTNTIDTLTSTVSSILGAVSISNNQLLKAKSQYKPSHKQKRDYNKLIKFMLNTEDKEIVESVKNVVFSKFGATKWEDICCDDDEDIIKAIRDVTKAINDVRGFETPKQLDMFEEVDPKPTPDNVINYFEYLFGGDKPIYNKGVKKVLVPKKTN